MTVTPPLGPPAPVSTPGANAPLLLRARGLMKAFGPVRAVDGIDLDLRVGDFLTVFGPNGSGKSSLLHMLAGTTCPSSGTVEAFALRTGAVLDAEASRAAVGFLSHLGFLYGHLTAEENLVFHGRLHGLAKLDRRVAAQLDAVRLTHWASSRVASLSHGMRRRLALARCLLHDPRVVLLDEPFTGLDPSAAATLRGVLVGLRGDRRGVVMVTHSLTEGLALANRVALCVRGRLRWQGDRSDLPDDSAAFYHRVVEGPHGASETTVA